MSLTEFICPTCGLRAFSKSAYIACAGCQTHFYASQSAKPQPPASEPARTPTEPECGWSFEMKEWDPPFEAACVMPTGHEGHHLQFRVIKWGKAKASYLPSVDAAAVRRQAIEECIALVVTMDAEYRDHFTAHDLLRRLRGELRALAESRGEGET